MSDTATLVTDEMKILAAKNEWGKEFSLGDQKFEIKDLSYFDYIEFVSLAKPLITVATSGLEMNNVDGEVSVNFNPGAVNIEEIIGLCGKELPKMVWLICKQSQPKITLMEVAVLAHRPQRMIEVVLLQILHNNMIQEFGSFFSRLTAMVSALVPDIAKVTAPTALTE